MGPLLKVDRVCLHSELQALMAAGANMFCFSVCESLPAGTAFQPSPRDLKLRDAVELARQTDLPCGVELLSLEDLDKAWEQLHFFDFVQFSAAMLSEQNFPPMQAVSRLRQASKAICYTHLQYVHDLSEDFWLEPLREIDCQAASVFQVDMQFTALNANAELRSQLQRLCGNYPLVLVAEKETLAWVPYLHHMRGVSFVLDDLSGQPDLSTPVMSLRDVLAYLPQYKVFAEAGQY